MPRAPQSKNDPELDDPFYRPRGDEPRRRGTAVAETDEEDGPDSGEDEPFLRGKKRVAVRKAGIRGSAQRVLKIGVAVVVVSIMGLAVLALRQYVIHSARFLIETSDQIQTGPLANVSRSQILEVFGSDIGRNIFFVDLEKRKKQLEQVPWIKTAAVMRFLPNHLRVEITERTPIAFVEIGSTTGLIDAQGVVMELPRSAQKFSFPVITGLNGTEPLSVRAARIRIFNRLEQDLDAGNAHYSADLSEVDLSDPEDVRVIVGDNSGTALVHLGSTDFQRRYRFYLEHINSWRQQYQVRSVDLRYDGQVIVNREGQATQK